MGDVVRVHPGADGRSSLLNGSVRAADHAQGVRARDDADSFVASCPLAQDIGSSVSGRIVQNDKLKIAKGLSRNAV
jgi:hypothetical protein